MQELFYLINVNCTSTVLGNLNKIVTRLYYYCYYLYIRSHVVCYVDDDDREIACSAQNIYGSDFGIMCASASAINSYYIQMVFVKQIHICTVRVGCSKTTHRSHTPI